MWTRRRALSLFAIALAVSPLRLFANGDVVGYIEAKEFNNPPPSTALGAFDRIEVTPITMVAPYAGQPANEDAMKRIQANLDQQLNPLIAEWNAAEAKNSPPKTLKVEPVIRHIKFVSGKARFWAGAMAGGSAILMTAKLTDAQSGALIAEPEFYQHANSMGAAWSMGGTDKAMLVRITTLMSDYLKANRTAAVGGPTGKETKDKK
jgi:hypothetical protein